MALFVLVLFHVMFAVVGGRGLNAASKNTDNNKNTSFDQNYQVTWGFDRVLSLNQGREIQLSMDNSSGAGFASKLSYGSGLFHLRIKLPDRDSAGVVTAFYAGPAIEKKVVPPRWWSYSSGVKQLTSHGDKHDELDFEFLGNREGKPYTLQTNVFANGLGNREQRTLLWFDPTADFHTYGILWNPYQIVFWVDDIPIRVFKNNKASLGVDYPSKPMTVEASLWNGESWATDGGRTKIDWSYAPFKAHFQGFGVEGCSVQNSNIGDCYSNKYLWNERKYQSLDSDQRRAYEYARSTYMNYDYCTDKARYPTPPPECLNQLQ